MRKKSLLSVDETEKGGLLLRDMGLIVIGSLLFSLSMNCVILPCGMYSGGFLGLAQLLRMLLLRLFPAIPQAGDLAGWIYLILNRPLLALAWFRFGRLFFAKTAACITCYSLFLALIPVPDVQLFEEPIAACAIGGLACGAGAGLTLTAGCSGGGEEIIGLLASQKNPGLSVGRISMIINIFVFAMGFLVFSRRAVVYSIAFACVTYLCLDRMHLQNVMVTMLIISKEPEMEQFVFQDAGRGVTKWSGVGAYSSETSDVLLTVVSKKEALTLRKILQDKDPNVFIILTDNFSVFGNFQKRV